MNTPKSRLSVGFPEIKSFLELKKLVRSVAKDGNLLKFSLKFKFKRGRNDLPDTKQKDMDQIEFGIC
jgi:hypothetical protein